MEETIGITQGSSLVKNTPGSRVRYNHQLKRIDFCDTRCYQRSEDLFYPSVTSILSAFPADPFFLEWMQSVGKNADLIRDKAAREGTQVHEGIESLLAGNPLNWVDEYGNARYNLQVWQMLLRFQDMYNVIKPKTLATEMFLYSDKYQYAGTTDYLCKVEVGDKPERWLLDWKSSNHISPTYNLQLSAYAKALEEKEGIKVDRCGIGWLKASTRTTKVDFKRGILQGAGWQILFVDDIDRSFELFKHVHEIYKSLHPKIEPLTRSYPTIIQI